MKTKIINVEGKWFILAYDEQNRGYVAEVIIETDVTPGIDPFAYLEQDLHDSGELDRIVNAE